VSAVVEVLSAALMLSGAVIAVIAAIGLHRLPDVYARMHVATKPATLGITLCLTGAALEAANASIATKLVLAIVFQLVTTPAAGHLLGRAAHAARSPVSEYTFLDELRPLPDRPDAPPEGAGAQPGRVIEPTPGRAARPTAPRKGRPS
jgi:multicomponent Na+:H+ antiporter subunit G